MNDGRHRVIIENVSPQVDSGRFPAKRAVGETLTIRADIFTDGHDRIRAAALIRPTGEKDYREIPMEHEVNDRWAASMPVEMMGDLLFTVEGWIDHFASWREGLMKKLEAGVDVSVELLDGAALVEAASARARESDPTEAESLAALATELRKDLPRARAAVEAPLLSVLMLKHVDRSLATRRPKDIPVHVEPPIAASSAWYELFPRSEGPGMKHGTFKDVEKRLPRIKEAGFDVVYLPPIHPIGTTFRKGRNNTPESQPGDVGSPWAIGSTEGGHKSIHSALGTMEDFEALVAKARVMGLEIALDIAFQCSPDHPYVKEHPEWFRKRSDGTIQYAENPPKKYQDVFPFDFECEDWKTLWEELLSVFTFWISKGVKVFRVDNPHTKPLDFWEWSLGEIRKDFPEAIFLSEAFTRPKVMYRLAKAGFTQSYTYFTWRNSKHELTTYVQELVEKAPRDFFRPNFWPNTPDILPEYLQYGGRPAFVIRLVLAATLSSNYGIYGPAYENLENEALPGTEEYKDSEKFEIKDRDMDMPGNLHPFIKRLNQVRRESPALRQNWNIRFLEAENDFVLFFVKHDDQGEDLVLVAVNLDPHNKQSAWLNLPVEEFGISPNQTYMIHDLLGDDRFVWQGSRNFMDFDPHVLPARIFRLKQRMKRETDFDYFM